MSFPGKQAQHEKSTPMHPLIFVTRTDLAEAANYPGEARFLALMPGLSGEIWYDDGSFTGLTRLTLQNLLAEAKVAASFQSCNGTCTCWFLLDRQNQHLSLGPCEVVAACLQFNVQPSLEPQGAENSAEREQA